jgi:uncharacterized protein (DUF924 family)
MTQVEEVIAFWREVGPDGWYRGDAALDQKVRARFEGLWRAARDGACADWMGSAEGALALILVLDQFPRNMFRDAPESFATDAAALARAQKAIARGHDCQIAPPLRQFFYLPFMHAESLPAQDQGIDLFAARMPGDNLRHARAHRAVIARFGRFPWRNAALGRVSSPEEQRFLADGGYAKALEEQGH